MKLLSKGHKGSFCGVYPFVSELVRIWMQDREAFDCSQCVQEKSLKSEVSRVGLNVVST